MAAAFIYWPIALVAAYLVIAGFYLRLSRSRGLGTRVRLYVITGLVLAAAAIIGLDLGIASGADGWLRRAGWRLCVSSWPSVTVGSGAPATMSSHPVNDLNDIVHQRVRLGILTIAHEAGQVEFGYLHTTLELTGGNLSQHLSTLENAGLITISEGYEGKRPRTWVSITKAGHAALRQEIAHLKRLIDQVERPSAQGRRPSRP